MNNLSVYYVRSPGESEPMGGIPVTLPRSETLPSSELIRTEADIDWSWLDGVHTLGLTAGASAPEKLVQEVIARLQSWGAGTVRELDGEAENITFALPKELRLAS